MLAAEESNMLMWNREEDKQFEKAIATYPEDSSDRWDKIALHVPGKSVDEIKHHYELLVEDINLIESGFVQVLCYNSSHSDGSTSQGGDEAVITGKKGSFGNLNGESNKLSKSDQERRKGIAWTEDEHRLFLLGLDKYGKGDWRSISRNFVVTRTPTQVASHAQKYFIRLNSMNKDRRRSSIHDITSINNSGDISVPQGTTTGQTNSFPIGGPSGNNANKPPPQTPVAAGVSMYGPPMIGQPIGGPLVSAVGTPVNLQPPAHLTYPIHGPVVTGSPMNMGPMTYPIAPHMPAHR
ncbi:hypothetical protein CASFOL_002513 [Castilleja foliolosa]|uniref:Uncharacterized protein n=1 Tax=Castilleja foliolosa TaxID=1961234 RepID=A0ABD3EEQ8_9LAMI